MGDKTLGQKLESKSKKVTVFRCLSCLRCNRLTRVYMFMCPVFVTLYPSESANALCTNKYANSGVCHMCKLFR